jgi:hypothetical protein
MDAGILYRKEAENNPIFYSLMNFMIAPNRNIHNWKDIQSLIFFDTSSTYELYRGLSDVKTYDSRRNRCTSWTTDENVAWYFAGKNGIVLCGTFDCPDIVFDTKYMERELFSSHKWQKEVIVKPNFQSGFILKQL